MKKLFSVLFVTIYSITFSQDVEYSRLVKYESRFLNKHDIHYASLFIRSRISVNTNYKKSWIRSYNKFIKWNNCKNAIMPDTVGTITGNEFLQNKKFDDTGSLKFILGFDKCKILQYWITPIRDKHIKNIWILEVKSDYSIYHQIHHVIICENHEGYFYKISSKSLKGLLVSNR